MGVRSNFFFMDLSFSHSLHYYAIILAVKQENARSGMLIEPILSICNFKRKNRDSKTRFNNRETHAWICAEGNGAFEERDEVALLDKRALVNTSR